MTLFRSVLHTNIRLRKVRHLGYSIEARFRDGDVSRLTNVSHTRKRSSVAKLAYFWGGCIKLVGGILHKPRRQAKNLLLKRLPRRQR